MVNLVFAVILLLIVLATAVLRKTYFMVPSRELKRQAVERNALAEELYRAVGHGESLPVLLWLVLLLAAAIGFVLLAEATSTWFAVIIIAAVLWLAFFWIPSTRVSSLSVRITRALTPSVVWALRHGDPFLERLSRPLAKHIVPKHSGLYELHDLLDLLDLQAGQADNRIAADQIAQIRQTLEFGGQKVRDVVQAGDDIKTVALTDAIGPVLLDELHASNQTIFPVKKTPRSKDFVGSLFIDDIGIHSSGTVEDYAVMGTLELHENTPLNEALLTFQRTSKQLAVVINDFDEYVGVLSLHDILQRLLVVPTAAPPVPIEPEVTDSDTEAE